MTTTLQECRFEAHGRVQDVSLRAYARNEANRLGLKGWIQNTRNRKIVRGIIQGHPAATARFKEWLRWVGSPESRVRGIRFRSSAIRGRSLYNGFYIKSTE